MHRSYHEQGRMAVVAVKTGVIVAARISELRDEIGALGEIGTIYETSPWEYMATVREAYS